MMFRTSKHSLLFFLFLCCLSSCSSCSNSGTTITGNPQIPITIGRVSDTSTSDISIPRGIFGTSDDVLDVSSLSIYVNDVLRTANLAPASYYNTTTEAVEFTISSIVDEDEIKFIINNSVDEYTYVGTASTASDTEATSTQTSAADDSDDTPASNTYTIANFYGRWSREQPCAGPSSGAPDPDTFTSWLEVSVLNIGGENCENYLYFDTSDEQPENTTSYSVSSDNLVITNSILGTLTLENVTFGGDSDSECINVYQFTGWSGDIALTFYAAGTAGDAGCDLEVFGE